MIWGHSTPWQLRAVALTHLASAMKGPQQLAGPQSESAVHSEPAGGVAGTDAEPEAAPEGAPEADAGGSASPASLGTGVVLQAAADASAKRSPGPTLMPRPGTEPGAPGRVWRRRRSRRA